MFFNRKANIKIESVVSSGSNRNYMKHVNRLWDSGSSSTSTV